MEIATVKIGTSLLDEFIAQLKQHLSFQYENHSTDMYILATEEYYIFNNSSQLNMIVAKKEGSTILVDAIGGAGGSGIFNINYFSESEFINSAIDAMRKCCQSMNWGCELVENK